MVSIKVLGPGCENCHKVEAVARAAAADLGVEADIVKITDRSEFARYNLLATPGLVIDEKLVAGGRIPTLDEVKLLIGRAVAV